MSPQMERAYDVVIVSNKRKVLTSCTAMFVGELDTENVVQMNECNNGAIIVIVASAIIPTYFVRSIR